jgi:hypothetical protein
MVQRTSAIGPWRADRLTRMGALLSGLVRHVEPVALVEQRFNFLPRSFRWRGDLWRVRVVAQVWEQPRAGWRSPRRYFEVVCHDDRTYILFQDLHIGTWHVSV